MSKSNAAKMSWKEFRVRNKISGGYLMRKKLLDIGVAFARFILLFGMCFMILQPILEKISVSFMTLDDIYNPVVISIPTKFITENYEIAFGGMRYTQGFVNTLIISISIAIVQVAMCTLVGYGFARFEFPFKKFWFACVMVVILVPPQTISTSLFLHFRFFDVLGLAKLITGETINLRNSTLPYFLMSLGCTGLKNGLYIFPTAHNTNYKIFEGAEDEFVIDVYKMSQNTKKYWRTDNFVKPALDAELQLHHKL